MAKRNANNSGSVTPTDSIHPGTITKSIWYSGDSLGIPDDSGAGDRHLSPSKTDQTERDRQILERLFALSKIDNGAAIAEQLIGEHGSLGAAMTATSELDILDKPSEILSLVQETLLVSSSTRMMDRKNLSKASDVIEYLILAMAQLPVEEIRVLFLDAKNCLIKDEVVSRGSISDAPIHPREILKRAMAVGATALILAHNHPSGDPEPSQSDIFATRRIAIAGHEMGIVLHDHIIVAQSGWISLADSGLLPRAGNDL